MVTSHVCLFQSGSIYCCLADLDLSHLVICREESVYIITTNPHKFHIISMIERVLSSFSFFPVLTCDIIVLPRVTPRFCSLLVFFAMLLFFGAIFFFVLSVRYNRYGISFWNDTLTQNDYQQRPLCDIIVLPKLPVLFWSFSPCLCDLWCEFFFLFSFFRRETILTQRDYEEGPFVLVSSSWGLFSWISSD